MAKTTNKNTPKEQTNNDTQSTEHIKLAEVQKTDGTDTIKKELEKTTLAKKRMLSALEETYGIVTAAVKIANISRSQHYEWMNEDPDYKAKVLAVDEIAIDFAETSLLKQVKKGIPVSTIFYLKTKGKKRGYVETQQVVVQNRFEDLSNDELQAIIDGKA